MPAVTHLTTARASNDGIGLNTAQSNVTWTVNSSGLSLDARGYAGTNFSGTNISGTVNSNGIQLSVAPGGGGADGYNILAAGTQTANSTGTVAFVNSNGITFGMSNNSQITASYDSTQFQTTGNYLTTAALSNHSHNFATTTTNGASIIVATTNSNGATIGVPAFLTTAQPVGAYLTTARASNDAVGLNTAQSNVTWTVNSNGISFNANGYAGTGFATTTTNGSVVVGTHATNGMTLAVPAYLTTAQAPGAYLTTAAQSNQVVNSLNGSTGQISLNVGSSLSSSTNGSSITFGLASNITTALQSAGAYLTTAALSNHSHNFATTTTNGASIIVATTNSNGATIGVPAFLTTAQPVGAYLTTARASNDAVGLNTAQSNVTWTVNSSGISFDARGYAGTGTSATNALVTLNSNGIAISVGAGGGVAMKGSGTYTQNTGTVEFANSNGITFGLSNNGTMTASHNGITSQTNQTIGLYALGNTTQNSSSTLDARSLSFNGLGGMTAGYSNGSIQLSAPVSSSLVAGSNITISTNGSTISIIGATVAGQPVNFSAGTTSGNLGSIVFSNSNGVSFGLNGSTITASAVGGGAGVAISASNSAFTSGTVSFNNSGALTIGTGAQAINFSVPATSSLSATGAVSISVNGSTISIGAPQAVTYSGFNPYADQVKVAGQVGQGTINFDPVRFPNVVFDRLVNNVNFTATSNSSGSMTVSLWNGLYSRNASSLSLISSFSTSTNVTMSGTVGSYSLFSGVRNITIPASMTVTEGDYWLAVLSRTTTGGAAGMTLSQQLVSNINSNFNGFFGVSNNTTAQITLGQGVYTATSNGLPSSVAFSQIRGSDSNARRAPFVMFANSTV